MDITTGSYEQDLKKIYRQLSAQELIYTQAKWEVYKDDDQPNIANNVATVVQWDEIQYDCLGVGISQNYGFLCPWKGLYAVIIYLQWEDTDPNHTYETRLYRDGARRRTLARCRGEGQSKYVGKTGIDIIQCERNAELTAVAYHQDGTNNPGLDCGWIAKTRMTVHLLSRQCPT